MFIGGQAASKSLYVTVFSITVNFKADSNSWLLSLGLMWDRKKEPSPSPYDQNMFLHVV